MERTRSPRHDPDDVQINVWMPRSLRDELKRVATEQDTDVSKILRRYARQHVAAHDPAAVA